MVTVETKYGYGADRWEDAKEEVRAILIRLARTGAGNTIPYSELSGQIQSIQIDLDSYAVPHMLGAISTEEVEADRAVLSVLVVHLRGDKRPGGGFSDQAKRLGRDVDDREMAWLLELSRVHDDWT